MFIDSTWVSKNKDTGIYEVIINTNSKWIDYQLNRYSPELNYISITNYVTEEFQPGQFDDNEYTESIFIEEGFNAFKYQITSMQEKDQIILVCIPDELLLPGSNFFKKVENG